jgi:hypothetical protein
MRKLPILFCFLLLLSNMVQTQAQKTGLELSSGIALPSPVKDAGAELIREGLQLNTGISLIHKKLGMEILGGYFENPLSTKIQEALPAASGLKFTKDSWRRMYGAIGPLARLGSEKLSLSISPKAGWMNTRVPMLGTRNKAAAQSTALSLHPEDQQRWRLYYSLGGKLQWQLSDQLGIHLRADYLATPNNAPGSTKQFIRDLKQNPGLENVQDELLPLVQGIAQQHSNVLNLGAGITYSFGKQEDGQEKQHVSCENSILSAPGNGLVYALEEDQRPDFRWSNPTEKGVNGYLFRMYIGSKVVYEEKTEKSVIRHQDSLEKYYRQAPEKGQTYSWEVVTYFADCEPLTSTRFTFVMSNRSGAWHDIFDLECDVPAYTDNGDLRLTGKISFFNNLSASDPLVINSFSDVIIKNTSLVTLPGVVLTNITDCVSSFPVPTPLSIAPGTTETYCFELTVPAGNTAIVSQAGGTINGLPQLSTDQDDLPQCACSVCDSWKFKGKISRLNYVSSGGNLFNAMVLQDIQIGNSDPIREVKAEVVYVEHVANDPECYTCTKHDNDMGLMSFGSQKPTVISSGNWANAKLAHKGKGDVYDVDNDNYVNQAYWQAADLINGVDFASASHRFRIPINLPQPSSLKCCDHRYEVCVRYTFTDVNCITCDYLVCYQMSTSGEHNGGIGTGTGVGSTPVGIGSPKIPLPKMKLKIGDQ